MDVGGAKTERLRRVEVADVRGHHHHLPGRQVEELTGHQIRFAIRLVMTHQLGRQNRIPRQAGELAHVGEQRDVAVRQRRNDVLGPQARQPGHRIGPPLQPVPDTVEMRDLRFRQPLDLELREQGIERHAVQDVELRPWQLP
jgi:hypothetical protein